MKADGIVGYFVGKSRDYTNRSGKFCLERCVAQKNEKDTRLFSFFIDNERCLEIDSVHPSLRVARQRRHLPRLQLIHPLSNEIVSLWKYKSHGCLPTLYDSHLCIKSVNESLFGDVIQ